MCFHARATEDWRFHMGHTAVVSRDLGKQLDYAGVDAPSLLSLASEETRTTYYAGCEHGRGGMG